MGEKKEKAKSILGFIALGCALVVACVVAAPVMAVAGVVVAGTYISAATVVGVTAAVATVGATAAVTKAVLHTTDGEYEEAIASVAMAVPLAASAYTYGNMYVGMTSTQGRMITGSTGSQAGSSSNSTPNQNVHGNSAQSTKPQHGYEIYDKKTGDVVKTGISGQPLNQNGTSPRANSQVNAWGSDQYGARVTAPYIPNRADALSWERANATRLWNEGNSMSKHVRPAPWR